MKSPQASYEWQIHKLRSPVDGTHIRYGIYRSKSIEPKRFIVFLNGRTEWIEKYEDLAYWLQLPAGYGFLSMDHRGQGGSEGYPTHVETYDHFIRDTEAVIKTVVGDRPYGLIGHSMGGLISLYGCLKGLFHPDFLVLSSPLLMLPNNPIPRTLSKPISDIISRSSFRFQSTGVSSFNQKIFCRNAITHCYKGFRRTQESQYTTKPPTFGWLNASFRATAYVMKSKNIKRLSCPTLVLGGSSETVVDYLGFPYWTQKASKEASVRVELCNIPGARHELLNEIPRFRNQAVRKIREWAQANHFFKVKAVSKNEAAAQASG